MPIEQYANLAFWFRTVPIAYLGIFFEQLCLFIYPLHDLSRCTGIVLGDIVVYGLQPCFCLNCPSYLCHERTRCPIFSLDITWPSLESIKPRSTIRSNASSLRISSYVASSGCDSITSFIFSLIAMDSLHHLRHNAALEQRTTRPHSEGMLCCTPKPRNEAAAHFIETAILAPDRACTHFGDDLFPGHQSDLRNTKPPVGRERTGNQKVRPY